MFILFCSRAGCDTVRGRVDTSVTVEMAGMDSVVNEFSITTMDSEFPLACDV